MKRSSLAAAALFAAGLLGWGCERQSATLDPAPAGEPWFADVTNQVGLDFVHDAGPLGDYFMPQAIGSGAALFDFDGDGRLDMLLLQNGGPKGRRNQLYRQLPDGRFQLVRGCGLDFAGYNMGVAIGDVNNDGWPDVLITQYGGVKLFLNDGDGKHFTDITEEAGLHNLAWGASAAFVDYNKDGWLDIVIANYVDYDPTWPCTAPNGKRDYCPPRTFPGRVCKLFRNLGRAAAGKGHGVRFEDVTVAAGLGERPGPGLGVVCADFNGDGWPDIFIANDGAANHLWINDHGRTFREEALLRGVALNRMGNAEAGMGIALGDVDGDGLFDLFVTHLTEETNTLWRQESRGCFRDQTALWGLAASQSRGTGFGVVLGDFNQDGWLDLAVVNGRVSGLTEIAEPSLGEHWGRYAERNRLFINAGKGCFEDVSDANPDFCGKANVGRGLVCGDVFGDGSLALLLTTAGGRARLYRNVAPHRGHWLLVRALDPDLKRDAYGAEVRVRAGKKTWWRLINPAGSYLCSGDVRAHFGLGDVTRVDAIEVHWPDGLVETFPGGDVDRPITLRRKTGAAKKN
jgi:hypothetical protein